jgi:hypothetical protein
MAKHDMVAPLLFLDLQNSTQLLSDQAEDNKAVICILYKQGHLWIFFKKDNTT